jgi:Uma2 family endonuclease
MSTISTSQITTTAVPDVADPFRYGWRFETIQGPDGTERVEQVPLTLEDVLHPEFGYEIMQNDPHVSDTTYLRIVFKSRLPSDSRTLVLTDCSVDFNLPGIKPVCPDIAVFFGANEPRLWITVDVRADRLQPALMIEVTSPNTRSNDVEKKFDYYHRARVPLYVIADTVLEIENRRRLNLIAYRYTPSHYEPIEPNGEGHIWLDPIGVWLGIVVDKVTGSDRLACFDPVTKQEIGDYTAIAQAHTDEMEARIRAEAQANIAEARANTAEARANTAEARASTADARANTESQARAAAEARIRELEAALKKQSSPGS